MFFKSVKMRFDSNKKATASKYDFFFTVFYTCVKNNVNVKIQCIYIWESHILLIFRLSNNVCD